MPHPSARPCPPRVCIIANRRAGSAGALADLESTLDRHPEVTLLEPTDAAACRDAAASAVREGYPVIAAAGGDGTVSAAATGLMRALGHPDSRTTRAPCRFGILPLGTGNDLARTLAIPFDPVEAFDLLTRGEVRPMDLLRARTSVGDLWVTNMINGGLGGRVAEAVDPDAKARWGPLAYLATAVSTLSERTDYHTMVTLDGEPPRRVDAVNVFVANARTVAGGFAAAPMADVEDGLLDLVIVRDAGLLDLAGVAARLIAGDLTHSDAVMHARARRVRLESEPPMAFNLDGEVLPEGPLDVTVVPGALPIVVGPDYARPT